MSLSAPTHHWNSKCDYHVLREGAAPHDVAKHILPHLIRHSQKDVPLNIADFACGKGAIAEAVLKQSGDAGLRISSILLIDVTQDNLEAASARIRRSFPNIAVTTFKCNGNNFGDYDGGKVNYFYSWDAMVHFDLLDVAGYVQHLPRVCNGVAFLHHSNFGHLTYRISDNPHWRNFMTKEVLAQLVVSSGMQIIQQEIIDWGQSKALDCLTSVAVSSSVSKIVGKL